MVLEHAPNKTLFDLFRTHPSYLPIPLVTHLFSQLMQAINHIHTLHIVHRDIKLENVFLFGPDIMDILRPNANHLHRTHRHRSLLHHNSKHMQQSIHEAPSFPYTSLTLKLADFGLSHTHPPATLSSVYHGSPHYQAPELWARVPHLPLPTDVWSAGVVLFAMVARRLPFDVDELEEWGGFFNQKCRGSDELHVETDRVLVHGKNVGKDDAKRPPVPRPGAPAYMPHDAVGVMTPAIDNLLKRLFALDPALRPTAREVLSDALFNRTECHTPHEEVSVLQDKSSTQRASRLPVLCHPLADVRKTPPSPSTNPCDAYDLYDIATLCTPPSTHVPPASFHGSSLEWKVQKRLEGEKDCIEKVWAGRLGAWKVYNGEDANKDAGEKGKSVEKVYEKEKRELQKKEDKEKKDKEKERKGEWSGKTGWSKSLGRIRGADVRMRLATLGHLGHSGQRGQSERAEQATPAAHRGQEGNGETKPVALKPKHGTSLSFRSLRIKTEHKAESKHPDAYTPSPLASKFVARQDPAPSIAKPSTLQPPQPNAATLRPPPSLLKPKLSIRTLRIKTDFKQPFPTADAPSPLAQTPTRSIHQPPQAHAFRNEGTATIRSRHDAVSHDVASTLQSRHDALLRRAYELGFRTQELRAFADEAGRIVRDAREEGTKGSVGEGDNEVAVGSATIRSTEGSSSTATTLVPENADGSQKSNVSMSNAEADVMRIVNVEGGLAKRVLDVGVDITFDVDFQTDSRWMSRWA